jgi:hypothetical protein
MGCIHKGTVPVIQATDLLLLFPFCHRGPHLSLVMYGVKMTEEAHVWVPAVSQMI